jgi:hypothetical protein
MSTWYHTLRDAGTSADYFKSVSSNPADVNAAAVDTKANTKNDATKGIAAFDKEGYFGAKVSS